MRKFVYALLFVLILVSAVGCSSAPTIETIMTSVPIEDDIGIDEAITTLDISNADVRLAFTEAPIEVYTMYASENGLSGKPYYIDGIVIDIEPFVLGDDSIPPLLKLKSNLGDFVLQPPDPNLEPKGWNNLKSGDSSRFYFVYTGMIVELETGTGSYIGNIPLNTSELEETSEGMVGSSAPLATTPPDINMAETENEPSSTPTQTKAPNATQNVATAPKPTEPPSAATQVSTVASDPYPLIREYAEKEWDNDSDMVEYEYKQQVEAYKFVSSLSDSDIKSYALQKWQEGKYTVWTMVKYEYEQQTEARDHVNNFPDSDIKNYALEKWQDGEYTIWTMVEYEYNQQMEAYNNIQNVDWDGKQAAIAKWTDGGYVVWTMVKYEYEHR